MRTRLAAAFAVFMLVLTLSGCKKTQPKPPEYVPYDYDLASYISLGRYIGVTYEPLDTKVRDDEITARICREAEEKGLYSSLLEGFMQTGLTDGEVAFGDTVNIDCAATVDNETLKEACVKGLTLEIGSDSVGIYGFERALVGLRVGEQSTFTLTLPNDYSDYRKRGAAIVFDVTVNKIEKRRTLPEELTDGQKSAITQMPWDEYTESVNVSIKAQKEENAKKKKADDCFFAAVQNSTLVSYPQIEMERYVDSYLDYLVENSDEDNVNAYAAAHKTSVEALREQGMVFARTDVLQEMFVYAVARREGFDRMSDELFDSFAIKYAKELGLGTVSDLTGAVGFYEVQKRVLFDVVRQYIADNGVPTQTVDPDNTDEEQDI